MYTKKLKQHFPIFQKNPSLIYLDNASTTELPAAVLGAMNEYYTRYNANVHRGLYHIAVKATEALERARAHVAHFIGGATEEIIFTSGATHGLNLLASSLSSLFKRGDEILLSEMEHHSNLVPWQEAAKKFGLILKFIPIDKEGRLNMATARRLIGKKTKVVSVAHMSNVLGTINPIAQLAHMAHAAGARMVVDGAQSAGHIPINVKKLGCDFFVFSGHKMYGPKGIGALWGRRPLLEVLPPFLFGGEMIKEVTFEGAVWNEVPWKFEAGTPNVAGAIGLGAAVRYLEKIGMQNVEAHEHALIQYALGALKKVKGLTFYGPLDARNRGGVFSFTIHGVHPHDLAALLDRSHIAVRGGHHCAMPLMGVLGVQGTTRASIACYTTKKDIDALVQGIKDAQRFFSDNTL